MILGGKAGLFFGIIGLNLCIIFIKITILAYRVFHLDNIKLPLQKKTLNLPYYWLNSQNHLFLIQNCVLFTHLKLK